MAPCTSNIFFFGILCLTRTTSTTAASATTDYIPVPQVPSHLPATDPSSPFPSSTSSQPVLSEATSTAPFSRSSVTEILATLSLTKDVKKREKQNIVTTQTPTPSTATISKQRVPGYVRSDRTYVVEDSAGTPCILAYFKSKITVSYPTDEKNAQYDRVVVSPPDNVVISGICDRDSQTAVLDLAWSDGTFSLNFAFDDLTDSWYVGQFSFKYDTSNSRYAGAETDEVVVVRSDSDRRWWTTSHARSFRCLLLHDVTMKDKDDRFSAIIHFDEARVQALSKTESFKTPKHCIHRVHRDEMVPVAVGGALAGLTLLTVLGYAIFRYFKVKKFNYDTME